MSLRTVSQNEIANAIDTQKVSKIFPLHKKGNKELVSNYRPTANLSAFSIVMAERVQSYLKIFNIIANSKFGYIKQNKKHF
ncbi:hypothetical protein KUF71_025863 [Frankliniella fusca]|uniref:Uncharacterized protein n=1 Tax=Frankliniella fusca TaxID=407009 RepID=A0AAE1H947_9NEOP|nr:hypothetical protein KUF71_025863 [Frankliniella fusca]